MQVLIDDSEHDIIEIKYIIHSDIIPSSEVFHGT